MELVDLAKGFELYSLGVDTVIDVFEVGAIITTAVVGSALSRVCRFGWQFLIRFSVWLYLYHQG